MLCSHCETVTPRTIARSVFPQPLSDAEWEPLRPIICAHCGAVLPEADFTGTMLGKLSQLARFGLVDGGPPLLEPVGAARGRARSGGAL